MTSATRISLSDAENLARQVLLKAGCSSLQATATARALVNAEADGHAGHGLSRLLTYAPQVKSGKVNGGAEPKLDVVSPSTACVDASHGFAYPALDLAIEYVSATAAETGIAIVAIRRSHHFGQAGAPVEKVANRGLIGLLFGNSPAAMALTGGRRPLVGTNPVAFSAPVRDGDPVVIDLATSVVARGRIVTAKNSGKDIPEGWAIDENGNPATDPNAALSGSLIPIGGPKGAAIALMIEILAAALTGSHFGFEASSFFDPDGDPPNVGQALLAIDPERLSGGAFFKRMSTLLATIDAEDGVRLPGSSRLASREKAASDGLELPPGLLPALQDMI